MPMLGQLVRSSLRQHNPMGWIERLPVYVIDGDVVEEKNLLRQNFISKDVGSPKAAVLATRYSNAYGIPIIPSTNFLDKKHPKIEFLGADPTLEFTFQDSLVILAVDSANARREILNYMVNNRYHKIHTQNSKCFVIDAGNEDSFGQVKFFNMRTLLKDTIESAQNNNAYREFVEKFPKQMPDQYKMSYIPYDPQYYKDLGSSTAELSCADLPQTLAINAMMATMICCIVQNFLQFRHMNYDGLRFDMNGSMSTDYNSPRRWLKRALPGVDGQDGYPGINRHMLIDSGILPMQNKDFTGPLRSATLKYSLAGLLITSEGDLVPKIVPLPKAEAIPVEEKVKEKKADPSIPTVVTEEVTVAVAASGVPELSPVETIPRQEPVAVPVTPPRLRPLPRRRAVTPPITINLDTQTLAAAMESGVLTAVNVT